MHVKKNDKVYILTGKDRTLTGEVIAIDRKGGRVKVARRNMITKHRKPNPISGEAGARVEQESWIDASNVALLSTETGGPVRTQKRWKGAGGELFESKEAAAETFGENLPKVIQKVRFAPKTGEVFE